MSALKQFNHQRLFVRLSFATILFTLLLVACSNGNGGIGISFLASPTPTITATPLPPTETPIPLAVTVNGEQITLDEFNAELERFKASQTALGRAVVEADAKKLVLDDLVSQVLLAQGAAESGFTVDDAALQVRIDALSAQIGGTEKLTGWQQAHGYSEAGFRAAFKRAIAAAWMRDKIISSVRNTAQQVHVRQILLYNEEVAQNYYNQIQAGADFDRLATLVDPITRGDIGWFPRGYLAEKTVEEAAFTLEVGAASAIIHSQVGYHIIKVLERQADRPLSPDALLALQNSALHEWLANRRQQSTIVPSVD